MNKIFLLFWLVCLPSFAGYICTGNAEFLQGIPISTTAPTDGQCLVYASASDDWLPESCGSGSSYTFADSIVNTAGTVTLVGDTAIPGDSQYYGTNSGGSLGYYNLPTITTGNLTDAGTDGITVTGGTGAVVGSGTSFAQAAASSSQNGYLTSANFSIFNSKQSALTFSDSLVNSSGTVTLVGDSASPSDSQYYGTNSGGSLGYYNLPTVSSGNLTDAGTDGITITGGTGAVLGSGTSLAQAAASASQNGYLKSTDWSTFNAKQASGNYITALTGDITASGPGSAVATLATVNTNTGGFGSSSSIPSFTVNGKGLITAASGNAVIAPAGTLTGTTLASNVVTSSLTTVGTIGTGVWNGTTIAIANGGTGQTSASAAFNALSPMTTAGDLIYGGVSGAGTRLGIGSTGNVLTVSGGNPVWAAPATSGTVTSVGMSVPGFLSVSGSPITSSGTLAVSYSGTALPIANGGTAVTSVTTAPTATSFAGWDAYENLSANNFIQGYQTTAMASGTTTLTVSSPQLQYFTGAPSQLVYLPVASTLVVGQSWTFVNSGIASTNIDVVSSGANSVYNIPGGATVTITCISLSGTDATSWSVQQRSIALPNNANINWTVSGGGSNTDTLTADSSDDLSYNGVEFLNSSGVLLSAPLGLTTKGDMIYENATPAPTRLPIGSNGNTLTVSGGIPTWSNGNANSIYFGYPNSIGTITINSPVTLTSDIYYDNLTITTGGSLNTAGYRIFVYGTLDLTACPANGITANGTAGTSATTTTGAAGGGAFTGQNTGGGGAGGPGGNGSANAGAQGTAGSIVAAGNGVANGGSPAASGKGGNGSTGAGGATRATTSFIAFPFYRWAADLFSPAAQTVIGGGPGGSGGGGGGGNTSNVGGGGGGGGGGAGVIWISANTINRSSVGTAASCISAIGGNGGNGRTSATAATGGGGGGSGGGGGWIFLAYQTLLGSIGTDTLDASGGSGGNGGNGDTTGHGADGGGSGGGGLIQIFNLGGQYSTLDVSFAGSTGIAGIGTSGGSGAGVSTQQQNL